MQSKPLVRFEMLTGRCGIFFFLPSYITTSQNSFPYEHGLMSLPNSALSKLLHCLSWKMLVDPLIVYDGAWVYATNYHILA